MPNRLFVSLLALALSVGCAESERSMPRPSDRPNPAPFVDAGLGSADAGPRADATANADGGQATIDAGSFGDAAASSDAATSDAAVASDATTTADATTAADASAAADAGPTLGDAGFAADATPTDTGVSTSAPTVTITEPQAGLTRANTITIRAAASDDVGVVSVQFFVDGGRVVEDTSAPYSVDINAADWGEGPHLLKAIATDTDGETAEATVAIIIDQTAPTVMITSPTNTVINDDSFDVVTVPADSNGIAEVQINVDGVRVATLSAAPWSYRVTGLSPGNHSVLVTAVDGAGNSATAGVQTTTDELPTVAITAPTGGAQVQGIVTVSATAMDDVSIQQVVFSVNGVSLGTDRSAPYDASWDTTNLPDGSYILEAVATDSRGQTASDTRTIATNDASPTVSFTAPAGGSMVNGDVVISAVASDDVGVTSVRFTVDGATAATDTSSPYSFTWDALAASEGAHTIEAIATDTSGQTSSAQLALTVADANPSLSWTAPATNASVTGNVALQLSASDDDAVARVEVSYGGAVIGTDTSAPYEITWDASSVALGSATLVATAFDSRGQSVTAARTVVVYDDPPTVVITAPSAGATVNQEVIISASASDNATVDRVRFDVGGATAEDSTSPFGARWDTCGWADGSYTIGATAYDNRGQTGTDQISVTVNNAVIAPTLAITSEVNAGVGLMRLSWTTACDPSSATGYAVYWSNSSGVTTSTNRVSLDSMAAAFTHGRPLGQRTYYRVAELHGASEGPLSNEVSSRPVLSTMSESEDNDTEMRADWVNGSREIHGRLDSGDEDWFRITVPWGGSVTAGATDDNGGCNVSGRLYLYSDWGTLIGYSNGGSGRIGACIAIDPSWQLWASELSGGTYYVRFARGNYASDYRLSVVVSGTACGNGVVESSSAGESCDDGNGVSGDGCSATCVWEGETETEPNDTVGSANDVGGVGWRRIIGVLSSGSDADIYSVDVPASGRIGVSVGERGTSMCDDPSDFVIDVIAPDGTTIVATDSQDPTYDFCPDINPTALTRLDAGRYHVRISGARSVSNYRVSISVYAPECGNRVRDVGEQCDDGANGNGDGCSDQCTLEPLTTIMSPGATVSHDFRADPFRTVYHQIEVTQNQSLRITATPASGSSCRSGLYMRLLDDDGAVIGSSSGSTGTCPSFDPAVQDWVRNLDAGTYYLKITNAATPASNVDIEVELVNPGCGNALVEPGLGENCDDGNTTAGDGCSATCTFEALATISMPGNAMSFGGTLSGQQDYYQIDVASETMVRVTGSNCVSAMILRMYDFNMNSLGLDRGTWGTCPELHPGGDPYMILQPGTYYASMELQSYFSTSYTYGLEIAEVPANVCGNRVVETGEECDDGNAEDDDLCNTSCEVPAIIPETESNNGYFNADDLFLDGPGSRMVTAQIASSNDIDIYSFTVPTGTTVGLLARTQSYSSSTTCSSSADTVLELRDEDEDRITSNDNGGDRDCSLINRSGLTAGTYYLMVRKGTFGNSSFSYHLDVELSP